MASIDRHIVVGLRRGPGFAKALHDHAWNALRVRDLQPAPGGRPLSAVEVGIRHPVDEPERWPNRPTSLRTRVMIVIILAALTVAAGVSDTLAHRSKIEQREELVQDGVEATAKIIGDRSDTITLVILDGPYAGFIGTRNVDDGAKQSPDDKVTVFHAHGNVKALFIVGYDEDRRDTGWILAAATLATAIGLGVSHRRALARQ